MRVRQDTVMDHIVAHSLIDMINSEISEQHERFAKTKEEALFGIVTSYDQENLRFVIYEKEQQ